MENIDHSTDNSKENWWEKQREKQFRKLEKEFNEWKGICPQTDDVLIIGLKI